MNEEELDIVKKQMEVYLRLLEGYFIGSSQNLSMSRLRAYRGQRLVNKIRKLI